MISGFDCCTKVTTHPASDARLETSCAAILSAIALAKVELPNHGGRRSRGLRCIRGFGDQNVHVSKISGQLSRSRSDDRSDHIAHRVTTRGCRSTWKSTGGNRGNRDQVPLRSLCCLLFKSCLHAPSIEGQQRGKASFAGPLRAALRLKWNWRSHLKGVKGLVNSIIVFRHCPEAVLVIILRYY